MEEGEENASLAETLTCMHARFYREHLVTAFEECLSPSGNLSRHLQMVCNIMHQMNIPLLLAGNVLPTGTTKFSGKGSDNCSILHVTFYESKCFIKCLNGLCAVQLTNKKKCAKSISLQELQPGNKKKRTKKITINCVNTSMLCTTTFSQSKNSFHITSIKMRIVFNSNHSLMQ